MTTVDSRAVRTYKDIMICRRLHANIRVNTLRIGHIDSIEEIYNLYQIQGSALDEGYTKTFYEEKKEVERLFELYMEHRAG